MYKIVTETKEVYIYSNEIVSITYVNIAGTELLEVLHEAAKNRFGKGNYYINKLLAIVIFYRQNRYYINMNLMMLSYLNT